MQEPTLTMDNAENGKTNSIHSFIIIFFIYRTYLALFCSWLVLISSFWKEIIVLESSSDWLLWLVILHTMTLKFSAKENIEMDTQKMVH